MNIFEICWGIFSGSAFLFFACVETYALIKGGYQDTYTNSIRDFFHTNTMVGKIIWFSIWLPFACWLAGHIGLGWA